MEAVAYHKPVRASVGGLHVSHNERAARLSRQRAAVEPPLIIQGHRADSTHIKCCRLALEPGQACGLGSNGGRGGGYGLALQPGTIDRLNFCACESAIVNAHLIKRGQEASNLVVTASADGCRSAEREG